MKKVFFLAMLSFILMAYSNHEYGVESINKSNNNYGYQNYGKETIESVHGNGSVILEGTKILGLVQVNGSLNAEKSAINSLLVNGQVDLHNCVIANETIINGSLNADNTKFQKHLSVAS